MSLLDIAVWDLNNRRGQDLLQRIQMICDDRHEAVILPDQPDEKDVRETVFLSFDTPDQTVLGVAKLARRSGESVFILLVASRGADLTGCLRPSIRPAGVLLRPVENQVLRDLIEEVLADQLRLADQSGSGIYYIKSGGAHYRVPVGDIFFFEASSKKIIAKTRGQEIEFSGALDSLAEDLPGNFVRCHRSFVVNSEKIDKVWFGEMRIKLSDGSEIPISRTFKEALNEYLVHTKS